MRTLLFTLLLLVGGFPTAALAQHTEADSLKQRLMALERDWLDAYENNDAEAMRRIVADGFQITYPSGRVLTKEDVLDGLDPDAPNDPAARQYTTDSEVRLFGNGTAVITGVYVYEKEGRPTWRARYTDTYVKANGRWQVAASGLSAAPAKEPVGEQQK